MTTATNLSELLHNSFSAGESITSGDIQDLMEVRGAHRKTARNRLADKIVKEGLATRIGKGVYVINNPPPLFRIQGMETEIRRREIGGRRSKAPKSHAMRRKAIRAMHLDGLWAVSKGVCAHCGGHMGHKIHADIEHVKALKTGGEDEIVNCVLAHAGCNSIKGALTRDEAQAKLRAIGAMVDEDEAQQSLDRQLAYGAAVPSDYLGE